MGWNYLSIPKLQRLHRWSLGMDKSFHPVQMRGFIQYHKWKCPILRQFYEGYVIHVWQFRYCKGRRQWK